MWTRSFDRIRAVESRQNIAEKEYVFWHRERMAGVRLRRLLPGYRIEFLVNMEGCYVGR